MSAVRHKNPFFDLSTWFLVITNLTTIGIAVYQNWQIGTVLFVYWGQLVAIGFYNVLRIRAFKKHVQKRAEEFVLAEQTAVHLGGFIGSFFTFHYSGFALFYLAFIGIFFKVEWKEGALTSLLFFLNHGISYLLNRDKDIAQITSAVRLVFFPYLRTIPMHIIISAAAITSHIGTPAVVVFLLLKTGVDVLMHIIEHSFNRFTFNEKSYGHPKNEA